MSKSNAKALVQRLSQARIMSAADDVNLRAMSVTDLKTVFRDVSLNLAGSVLLGSKIIAELERRGEDTASLRVNIFMHFRQIADGSLIPEMAVAFQSHPAHLKELSRLRPEEQRKVMQKKAVAVLRHNGTTAEPVSVPLINLSFADLRRVVDTESGTLIEPSRQMVPSKRASGGRLSNNLTVRLTEDQVATLEDEARSRSLSVNALVIEYLERGGAFRKAVKRAKQLEVA